MIHPHQKSEQSALLLRDHSLPTGSPEGWVRAEKGERRESVPGVFPGYKQLSCLNEEAVRTVIEEITALTEKESFVVPAASHSAEGEDTQPHRSLDEWVKKCLDQALTEEEWSAAKVVGFGEGSHGTSEYFETQAAGTRYMIEHRNARCVLLEVPAPFVMLMEVALQAGSEDQIYDIITKNPFVTWSNPEICRLLHDICKWNKDHPTDRVHVVGIDPFNIQLPVYRACLLARITDTQFKEAFRDFLEALEGAIGKMFPERKDPEDLKRGNEALTRVKARLGELNTSLAHLTRNEPPDRYLDERESAHLATACLKLLEQNMTVAASTGRESDTHYLETRKRRDLFMAKRVMDYVQREERGGSADGEPRRLVLLAHNSHVQSSGLHLEMDPNEDSQPPFELLGSYLREYLKGPNGTHGYRAFVSTGAEGTVTARDYGGTEKKKCFTLDRIPTGSLEDILGQLGDSSLFLNVKALKEKSGAGDFLKKPISTRYQGGDAPWARSFTPGLTPGESFDGVFFHRKVRGVLLPR